MKQIFLILGISLIPLSLFAAKPVEWSLQDCEAHMINSQNWIQESEMRKRPDSKNQALMYANYHLSLYNSCLNTKLLESLHKTERKVDRNRLHSKTIIVNDRQPAHYR